MWSRVGRKDEGHMTLLLENSEPPARSSKIVEPSPVDPDLLFGMHHCLVSKLVLGDPNRAGHVEQSIDVRMKISTRDPFAKRARL